MQDGLDPAPPRRRRPTARKKETPLTEADWVGAATDILLRENVRGIRIDALCARLGVTKGSFYHHFANRAELLAAMLHSWRRRMTTNVIRNLGATGEGPRGKLAALIAMPRKPRSAHAARIEQSIRDWGRRVEGPADAVGEVDAIRMEFFVQLFGEQGFEPDEARRRGYLAYCIMMGDSILQDSAGELDHDALVRSAVEMLSAPASR